MRSKYVRVTREELPALPDTIGYDLQPYGRKVLGNLHWEPNGNVLGAWDIVGTVVQGSDVNRLFQYTSTRSVVGEHRRIHGVQPKEVLSGHIVRVAM